MITFREHNSPKYPPRTWENASADITLAFGFNFKTPGEQLTYNAVVSQGKIYKAIHHPFIRPDDVSYVIEALNAIDAKSINIAGNGLYTTIKYGYNQSTCDDMVGCFLHQVFRSKLLAAKVELIRSGGQSGFDEAGIKAAVDLKIPALVVCPKGWKFMNEKGEKICDERKFKERFGCFIETT